MQRKYFGRILAAIGLVLLASSVLTWLIGAPLFALAKVLCALVLFVVFVVTNFGSLGESAASRGTFFFAVNAASALLLLAALVFANHMASKHQGFWDLTKDEIHSLGPDTLKTLEGLKDDVKVLAFFEPEEPAREQFRALLGLYEARSTHLKVQFVNPAKDPTAVGKHQIKAGGARVLVMLGALEARVGEPTEEALTNALVKVTHSALKKLYFTQGHGESGLEDTEAPGLSKLARRMANEGLKAEPLSLIGADVPQDAEAVVVAGPTLPFQPEEVERLESYLELGGKLLLMLEPKTAPGFDALLQRFNIEADDALVVDPRFHVRGTEGFMPVVDEYNKLAELTRSFNLNTAFLTARPLTVIRGSDSPAKAEPVALVRRTAWAETNLETPDLERDETEKGGPFPVVALSTLDTSSVEGKRSSQARLLVAGDRDFATNKFSSVLGNEDFALNCLHWLAEQTDRITIRPRMREASRLFLTEPQKATIFFFTFDILPVTLLAVGLTVWLARRGR